VGIEFGGQPEQEQRTEGENTNSGCAKMVAGWAAYQNSKRAPLLSSDALKVLKQLFDLGRTDKSKRISADRAHVIVMEQVAARNWYEKMIFTVARIKVFYSSTPAKMADQIRKSEEAELVQEQQMEALVLHQQQQEVEQTELRRQQQHHQTAVDALCDLGMRCTEMPTQISTGSAPAVDDTRDLSAEEEEELRELEEAELEILREICTDDE
jgi:uncharacterized protein with von Willebrand factor type A (vWA) domain